MNDNSILGIHHTDPFTVKQIVGIIGGAVALVVVTMVGILLYRWCKDGGFGGGANQNNHEMNPLGNGPRQNGDVH